MANQFLIKETMADMTTLSTAEIAALQTGTYDGVQLLGYHQKGDTPAPIIYYLAPLTPDPGPDDGGSVIHVGGIKLVHKFVGEIDARYFGVQSNVDAKTQLIAISAYISSNTLVSSLTFKGLSSFEISGSIVFNLKRNLELNGSGVLVKRKLGTGGVVIFDFNCSGHNLNISDINFDGTRNNDESFYEREVQIHVANNARTSQNTIPVRVNNYTEANINTCSFKNIHGWGIYSLSGNLLTIDNCVFENIARTAVESNREVIKTIVRNCNFGDIGILPDKFKVNGTEILYDQLVDGSKYFTDNGDGVMFLGHEGHCYNCIFTNVNRLNVVYDVPNKNVNGKVFIYNNTIYKKHPKTRCSNPSGIFWIEYGHEAYIYDNKAFMYQTSPEDLVCQGIVFARTDRSKCNVVIDNNQIYNISYNRSLVGINFSSFNGNLRITRNTIKGTFYGCLVHNFENGDSITDLEIDSNYLHNTNPASNSSTFIIETSIGFNNLVFNNNYCSQQNKILPSLQTRNLGKSVVTNNHFNGGNVLSGFVHQVDLIFADNTGVGSYEFNKNSGAELSKVEIVNNDIVSLKMFNSINNTAGTFAYTGTISGNRLKSPLQISSGKNLRITKNEIDGGILLLSPLHANDLVVVADNDIILSAINQTGIYINNTISATDITVRNNSINGRDFSGGTGIFYQVPLNRTNCISMGNHLKKLKNYTLNDFQNIGGTANMPSLDQGSLRAYDWFNTDTNTLMIWDGFVFRSAAPNASASSKGVVSQAAVSPDSASNPSTTYTQMEVQSILLELRDLKAKLRTAGILAT
ncbi:hypothetical protein [Sphingobacterium detergens]|uniref:Parallel beta helix pectate lyase-like protein n=1 Tax=Sphingobacterium detergens TaxID=1145106 RepID=A0A420BF76_SPHD1|nr:hypothetical protein [Sphingobacterium detergens]RKE55347.1 hypothetical protein DFQ12_0178 [Sphingobacterium detergens]